MTLSRRKFLGFGSLLVAGCSSIITRGPDRRDVRAAPRVPTPYFAADDGPRPLPDAQTCGAATVANIEGPFYKAGAPRRAVLADAREPGERLVIAGSVLTTDCKPIAGAELDVWHADARGGYDNDGYHLRGKLVTDDRGRFELHTIVPGRYLNGATYRPAHVHVKLRAAGYRTLTTQLYFAGDPYNDADLFIVESLIMHTKQVGTVWRAAFDFVLA